MDDKEVKQRKAAQQEQQRRGYDHYGNVSEEETERQDREAQK